MAWTKSPQSLIDLFDESVPSSVTVSRRKMFGYPAAFANGNLFIGLHQNDFIMRLSEEDRTRFSAKYGERWFESMKNRIIDMGGHFSGGREISKAGTKDLPLGLESITGFTIVSAESIDDAEKIAQSNPYISSIRVYEVMSK